MSTPYLMSQIVTPHMCIQSPPDHSQWVVRSDYTATEPSMLSVKKGELVKILDRSKNDWCLIRPSSRADVEGWVPATFLAMHEEEGAATNVKPSICLPKIYALSISDNSTEISGRSSSSPTVTSPAPVGVGDTEEYRSLAAEKTRWVIIRM